MTKELNNLLSLLFQDARTVVKDGRLLVPPEIAKRFGDQIRKHKPEIMIALGFCPECGGSLTVEVRVIERAVENATTGKTGRHSYCVAPRHFDKWEF